MRIGLYGMPGSGKTYLLGKVSFIEVLNGSQLLHKYDPDFDHRDEMGRRQSRKAMAACLMKNDDFIMDGHFAFGDEVAFTNEDGELYDVFIYLFTDPEILRKRMEQSPRNQKYLRYDIPRWQNSELNGLRSYCHLHNKDFYVIDSQPAGNLFDAEEALQFLAAIVQGFSCYRYAEKCAAEIEHLVEGSGVKLFDGDKTLTIEDSSNAVFGYDTHIFDGNFYTGYQSWKEYREFAEAVVPKIKSLPVSWNARIKAELTDVSVILTSGHPDVWSYISNYLGIPFFADAQMSADTKYFITKLLQASNKKVSAYGDSMNDYYMLKQADDAYLVRKKSGKVSGSLKGVDLGGIKIV